MYSAGNVAQTINNAKGLKVTRTFVKATAKETILLQKDAKAIKMKNDDKKYLES